MRFSNELPREFYEQLTAEQRVLAKVNGKESYRWISAARATNSWITATTTSTPPWPRACTNTPMPSGLALRPRCSRLPTCFRFLRLIQ